MQANNLIRQLVELSGKSYRQVSAACGRSGTWAGVVAQPSRSPSLATVVEIADACGYDVAIVSRETGETLGTVEPTRRG